MVNVSQIVVTDTKHQKAIVTFPFPDIKEAANGFDAVTEKFDPIKGRYHWQFQVFKNDKWNTIADRFAEML